MAFHVVIAGGGFGGLYAARRLESVLARHSATITLVTETNYLLYTPLLPGAAAGSLEPRHVVVPAREELGWTEVKLGSVTGGDARARELGVRTVDGRDETLGYDHLILALGSVSRTLPVPGLAEHGLGFKDLPDAVELRNRALWNLEVAESLPDREQRRAYLTFVFVGAGYAGVEGIAELQDFVNSVIHRYPRCRIDGTRWVLVEAENRIMQEIPESLAEFATRELRGRGLEIYTNTTLEEVTESAARLSDGQVIRTRSVCWTAGVRPHPVVERLRSFELFGPDGMLLWKRLLPMEFAFVESEAFERMARDAGFRIAHLHGDYARSSFDLARSPVIVWDLKKSVA